MADSFERQRWLFGEYDMNTQSTATNAQVASNEFSKAIRTVAITFDQAERIRTIEESQFADVKAAELAPGKASRTFSAFANADGGELFVGIRDETRTGYREWRGFSNPEAANGLVQVIDQLFPLGQDVDCEFLKCQSLDGVVLHVQVHKTKSPIKATNGVAYVRRGAQDQPCDTPEKFKQLEYAKGIASF